MNFSKKNCKPLIAFINKKILLTISLLFTSLLFFGQEVLVNGSFESWDDVVTPTGWTHVENTTQETIEIHGGTYSADHVGGIKDLGQLITGIIPGEIYTLTIWYKVVASDGSDARIWSKWSTDGSTDNTTDAAVLQGPSGGYLDNNGGMWTTYTTTVTAPALANEFYFEVRTYSGATTYWDDFSFFKNSSDPTITTSTASLTGYTYIVGNGPSAEQSFTVEGTSLTNDISIAPGTNWEISTDTGGSFVATNPITLTQASGSVATTTIYTRLKSGLPINTYSENISATSTGATQVDVAVDGSVTNVVDSCTLHTPAIHSMLVGDNVTVIGKAYEPWLTGIDESNPGVGISAWVGYSNTNNDPSNPANSGDWTWLGASYLNDDGFSDDEYYDHTFGSLLSVGTYYLVSRFQINSDPYQYGGTGGIWSSDSGVLTINAHTIDWCNLQWPNTHTMTEGNDFTVYARVNEDGVTGTYNANAGAGITAYIGYSTTDTDPSAWTDWEPAAYNALYLSAGSDVNDEYLATFGAALAPGTYYYASRFDPDGGTIRYGGYDDSFWDGTTYISGILTIQALAEIDVQGNTISITNTDSTPSLLDDTDFGSVPVVAGTAVHTFTIENQGYLDLTITSVSISGANASDFTVTANPSSPVVGSGTTTFEITFDPSDVGIRVATVSIINSDTDEDPYTFDIQGNGFYPCTDLYISEYIEGSNENKFIEIYNPTATTIDLSDYELHKYLDGSATVTHTLALSGTLTPYDVFVIENEGENLSVSADLSTGSVVMDFNGDDVVALYKLSTTSNIDIIGQIGFDPGSEWVGTVCTNGTEKGTLVRNSLVQSGDADGSNIFDPDTEWTCYSEDTIDYLGYHLATCIDCANVPAVWSGAAWTNVIGPDSDTPAIIIGDYNTSTDGNFETCTLVLIPTFTITVPSGSYVNVVNEIYNNGSIVIEHEGSLVQQNDAATNLGSGSYTILKTTTSYTEYDYTYWSSPVDSETIGSVFALNPASYIFTLNPTNFNDADADGWDDNTDEWIQATGATTMIPGVGYIAMGEGADFPFDSGGIATGLFQDVVFDGGKVNNGVVTVTVTNDENPSDGWTNQNLIGNPYPSGIDANQFLTANITTLEGTLYFWTHNTAIEANSGPEAYDFTNADYATYNLTGATVTTGGALPAPNGTIAPGQGFLANVIDGQTSVIFNNAMRVTTQTNAFYRTLESNDDTNRVWLNLTNDNGIFRQILVAFMDEATQSEDAGYDGKRMYNSGYFDLYSVLNGERYAIQTLPAFTTDQVVPLGVEIADTGIATISIDRFEGIFNTQNIYIVDYETGIVHNLTEGDYEYRATEVGVFDNRFELRFTTETLAIDDDILSTITVYPNPSSSIFNISLRSNDTLNIEVYDLTGKVVLRQFTGNQIDLTGYAKGIYYAKLSIDDAQTVKKLVLK